MATKKKTKKRKLSRVESISKWCRSEITLKEGHRWSNKDPKRAWIERELFAPATGFKLWRKGDDAPCDECIEHIGKFVDQPEDNPRATCKECPGLEAEPQLITLLNLDRQDGKSTNTLALVLYTLFREFNKSVAFLAASEDQADKLFEELYVSAIKANPRLEAMSKIVGSSLYVPDMYSRMEALPASHRSVTGRTRTHIIIDEARDIAARIVVALIPSILAMGGIECPKGPPQRGHTAIGMDGIASAPTHCVACSAKLRRWWPRIIITSSSGVIDEGGKTGTEWMPELITEATETPRPNIHIFQSTESLNPRKSAKIADAMGDIFGTLPSTREYAAAEFNNQWQRRGDAFISKADVAKVTDKKLINAYQCDLDAVGFLDTSISNDLTALVLLATQDNYATVEQRRIDIWDPSKMEGGVIDDDEITDHMMEILPLWPNLARLRVDTRGMPWALKMVKALRAEGFRFVDKWEERDTVAQMGYTILEQRIRRGTIKLQANKIQAREFSGLMRKVSNANTPSKVLDRNRKTNHADTVYSLAVAAYLAHVEQHKKARSGEVDEVAVAKQIADLTKLYRPEAANFLGGM